MNGLLSGQPLAELIREIASKTLSGRLRIQHEQLTVVVYFNAGVLIYAACNAKKLRLREYLTKDNLIPETGLSQLEDRRSDIELARTLTKQNLLTQSQADQIQLRQVSDVLRLALLWTDGKWDFDSRARLSEHITFHIASETLLLEAARRMPLDFVAARFGNPTEVLTPVITRAQTNSLEPRELSLLSRLQKPTALNELVSLTDLGDLEVKRLVYGLTLAGLITREHWKAGLSNEASQSGPVIEAQKSVASRGPGQSENTQQLGLVDANELEDFLARISKASTHYDVLDVTESALPPQIKASYYRLARRYHPDRFRKESSPVLQARIESAFARITQAYDTLRDTGLRSSYDSKREAQARARESGKAPPGNISPSVETRDQPSAVADSAMSDAQRAEVNFREGLAARELGQVNVAIGLFASAARLVPGNSIYRAHYGQALAAHQATRRHAEGELQAALKIEPNNPEYRLMLATLYRDLGFIARARREAERAMEITPNSQEARELLQTLN